MSNGNIPAPPPVPPRPDVSLLVNGIESFADDLRDLHRQYKDDPNRQTLSQDIEKLLERYRIQRDALARLVDAEGATLAYVVQLAVAQHASLSAKAHALPEISNLLALVALAGKGP